MATLPCPGPRQTANGLKSLGEAVRPAQFTDKAIEYSRTLASLFKSSTLQAKIRVWSGQEESISVTRAIATHAVELLSPAYEEDGAVDGTLEKLDAHGKLQFVIYDVIDDRSVKCEVTEEQLEQVWGNFRKRVEVIGTVKYRKDGMPVSIKEKRIVPYPDKSQIPTLQQMRKLLAGA